MTEQTNETLIPAGLPLVEYASINWVLGNIRAKILTGVPSGVVIDQAIDEVLAAATNRSYSALSADVPSEGES
jgi:hypothetical protein